MQTNCKPGARRNRSHHAVCPAPRRGTQRRAYPARAGRARPVARPRVRAVGITPSGRPADTLPRRYGPLRGRGAAGLRTAQRMDPLPCSQRIGSVLLSASSQVEGDEASIRNALPSRKSLTFPSCQRSCPLIPRPRPSTSSATTRPSGPRCSRPRTGVVCHIDSLRCCGFASDYTVANR